MPRRRPKAGVRTSAQSGRHIPVLLATVLEALKPKAGETYIDATFGAGGYARAILEAADCKVTAFDRDPTAVAAAAPMLAEFGDRLQLLQAPFGDLLDMAEVDETAEGNPPNIGLPNVGQQEAPNIGLPNVGATRFDGVVFDLGVSSMQLDTPERGFSFQADGPLDMRMGSVGLLDTQQAGAESSDLVHKTSVNTAQARVELQAGVEPSDLVHKTSVNTAQARVEPQAGVESSDLVHKTSVNTAQARVELQAGVEPSDLVHTQQAGVEPHKANADDEETTGVGSGSNIGLPNAGQQKSAADVVNTYDEEDIANIIYRLGDERRSRAIAKAIVARREEKPFSRTLELAELVQKVLGRGPPGKHPATRTFQALRLYVNDELGQLVKGLAGAERVLKPGGRLVVVTFHSLEDRIVKRYFASRSGKTQGVSRHMPQPPEPEHPPSFQIINSRSLTSSKAELEANPRARSARLRFGVRTDAEAWPVDAGDLGLPLLKV